MSLFLANQRSIYRYILTLVSSAQDAEDVLQDTASVLWTRLYDYRGDGFLAWASQIAYYKVLEHRRRVGRAAVLLDDDVLEQLASVPQVKDAQLDVQRAALDRCLQRLVPADRLLLERRYSPAMTGKLLAAQLGRPTNSVYKSLGRIRRALVDCIRRTLSAAEREGEAG
jgi:RNA polymerase sigma-70 factor (ECF subfamily)